MCVFAIGIEHALMVAMDRLHHAHLSKDHRAVVLSVLTLILCPTFNAATDTPQALSSRRITMEHKGVEYTVMQMADGAGWRWEVRFGGGKIKSGVTSVSRDLAIKLAQFEIDRVIKDNK
jgi:hypothetical protein